METLEEGIHTYPYSVKQKNSKAGISCRTGSVRLVRIGPVLSYIA